MGDVVAQSQSLNSLLINRMLIIFIMEYNKNPQGSICYRFDFCAIESSQSDRSEFVDKIRYLKHRGLVAEDWLAAIIESGYIT